MQTLNSVVLPILSYASKVWGVDEKISDAAELLHRWFWQHLLGVRQQYSKHYCNSSIRPLGFVFPLVATNATS